MVIVEVGTKYSAYRAFIEHDHMVETLTPNGANHPFYVSSLPGRMVRRQHLLYSHISQRGAILPSARPVLNPNAIMPSRPGSVLLC